MKLRIFAFTSWLLIAVRSLKKLFLVVLSVVGLAPPLSANTPPPTVEPAIDRVDIIREQLLRHDRERGVTEQKKLVQRPSWPDWRDWRDFPNYRRNY